MLQKKQVDASAVEVTFRIAAADGAQSVCLAGDFNDWSTEANPMAAGADGFSTTLELEPGWRYRFRYVLDGERWENDWAADAYEANQHGGEDSVVDLTGEAMANLGGDSLLDPDGWAPDQTMAASVSPAPRGKSRRNAAPVAP